MAHRPFIPALALLLAAALSMGGCASEATAPAPETGADGGTSDVATEPAAPVSQACRSELSSGHPAVLGWWEALETQDYAQRDQVIDDLKAALETYPDEGEFALSLGLAHLWRLAEWDRYEGGDPAGYLDSVGGTAAAFVRARELCPGDYRITAWLGPVWIRMGLMTGDQAMVDDGWSVLEEGIAAYPEFVLFSRALILGDLPPDDPDFQGAIDTLWENFAFCAGESVDPENPPIDTFLISTEDGPDSACRNGDRAEHNTEGTAIFFGDLFAKNGDADLARAIYTQGTQTSGYATWPFKALLDERIATVDARVAAYQDDDPDNDPLWIGGESHQCSVCHAR